jgi:hypothetical protein
LPVKHRHAPDSGAKADIAGKSESGQDWSCAIAMILDNSVDQQLP